VDDNVKDDVVIAQPKDDAARKTAATSCSTRLKISMPVLVDKIDNRVDSLYAGWPERMFVVDREGKIAYAGKQGPWGFKPQEVAEWLKKNLGPTSGKTEPRP